jgi:TonB family protein
MRTADRWQRVQEIFNNAADLPESDQAAYLERACLGDAALRAAVERMLVADRASGDPIAAAVRNETVLLAGRADPLSGKGKVGKYEVLAPVGEGGFGVVYKGRDPMLQRFVAIKVCSSHDKKIRQRFFREAQIAAGLQHPNVVTIHDLGIQDGLPYLVQEYLEGEDLDRLIARGEKPSLARSLDILAQVAQGLAYAHGRGVLHRDVKPANVRLAVGGVVKLMDFGIARLLGDEVRLTSQGQTLGTIGYLAPEQLRGEEPDRRSDIFSFGVLAFELLAGERPFAGETFTETALSLLQGEPPALARVAPDCPAPLAELVERCLAREPTARPETLDEVLAVLRELGREPPLEGPPRLVEAPAAATSPRVERSAAVEVERVTTPRRRLVALQLLLLVAAFSWVGVTLLQRGEAPAAVPVAAAAPAGWPSPPRLSPAERLARLKALERRLSERRRLGAGAPTTSLAVVAEVAAASPVTEGAPPAPAPGDLAPELLERVAPVLPAPVALEGREVQLVVGVLVDAQGAVTRAEVRTPEVSAELAVAALAAARASRFAPARRRGEPIAAWTELEYRFR